MARLPNYKAIILEIPKFESKADSKTKDHEFEAANSSLFKELIKKIVLNSEKDSAPFEADPLSLSEYKDLLIRKRIEMFPERSLNELINLNITLD